MSISKKAVLVALSIGGIPEPRRQDRKVRAQVAKRHKVDEKQVDFQKFLWDPEAKSYVALKQWATRTRQANYDHTLSFAQEGVRFLKADEILTHKDRMRVLEEEGVELFDDFVRDLNRKGGLKDKAKAALGSMYDESLYPNEKKLRARFCVAVDFLPVPDSGNVVLDMVTDEVTKIVKSSTEKTVKSAIGEAMKEAWGRMHEVTSHMATMLSDPERRFHDTLVENVRELCDILPSLNLIDDPKMAEMTDKVRKTLGKYSPQTLRDDPAAREKTAKSAKEIAELMSAFL